MVKQLRVQLGQEDVRRALSLHEPNWQDLTEGDTALLVQALVETIHYEGASGTVAVNLRTPDAPEMERERNV